MRELLLDLVRCQRAGSAVGIPLVCSAHPLVIETAASQSFNDGAPLLLAATANQADQLGGYPGR